MAEGPNAVPPGATDTHVHIYKPGCGDLAAAAGRERGTTLAAYRAEMVRLGLARAVLVQPSVYGEDNGCMLAALAALGPAARGVAIVSEDVRDRGLDLLGAQGITGLRGVLPATVTGDKAWECLARLAPRIAERDWHLDLELRDAELPEREPEIRLLPGNLVIARMGWLPSSFNPAGPGMAALLRLIDTGRAWVKLSPPASPAPDSAPPRGEDVLAVARRLVAHAPDRCLWASNWPNQARHSRPDMPELPGFLSAWAPDERVRRQILVDNPAALYGFGPS